MLQWCQLQQLLNFSRVFPEQKVADRSRMQEPSMEGKTSTKPHAKNSDATQSWIYCLEEFCSFPKFHVTCLFVWGVVCSFIYDVGVFNITINVFGDDYLGLLKA